jgi:hypothetical protein
MPTTDRLRPNEHTPPAIPREQRERALSRIRSPELKRGRTPCRRRTASSWRSTTTSTAFAASQRRRTLSSPASRRTSQSTVEAIIRRSSHPPPAQRLTGFPAPTGIASAARGTVTRRPPQTLCMNLCHPVRSRPVRVAGTSGAGTSGSEAGTSCAGYGLAAPPLSVGADSPPAAVGGYM